MRSVKEYLQKLIISLLLILAINQSCAPFKPLNVAINDRSSMIGTFRNDCDSLAKNQMNIQLWDLIDRKNQFEEKNLSVWLESYKSKKLKAFLVKDSTIVLAEKIVKGKFLKNDPYITHRQFYVIPILPILWGFSNDRVRLYATDDFLIREYAYNSGGAFLFFAGGSRGNSARKYRRVN